MVLSCRIDETLSKRRPSASSSSGLKVIAEVACLGIIRCTNHSTNSPHHVYKCDLPDLEPIDKSGAIVCPDLLTTALYFKNKVKSGGSTVRCVETLTNPFEFDIDLMRFKERVVKTCDMRSVLDRELEMLRAVVEHFADGSGQDASSWWEKSSYAIKAYFDMKINNEGYDQVADLCKTWGLIDNKELKKELCEQLIERFKEDVERKISNSSVGEALKYQYEYSQRTFLHLIDIWTKKNPQLPSVEQSGEVVLINPSFLHDFEYVYDFAFRKMLDHSEKCRKGGCNFEIIYFNEDKADAIDDEPVAKKGKSDLD